MANIALDIKANTSKALGEFKKLSRELDNKFLVQGLKLDVVKNAFRQINREFEQSLGQQGFNTTETTNQLQRNAAANLAILNKLGTDAANEVTQSVRKNLQFLQAEGKITGETIKESLTAASFFDFSGSEAEVKRQFESFTKNFATVSQDLSDAFGESGAGQFQKVLTGQARLDDLFGVDFGPGGASKNLILKAIRENYGNIDAVTGEARTRLIEKILADFQDTNTEVGKILDDQRRAARRDDPFRQITRELQGLFSPQGLFGNLRQIGGTFANLDGEQVPRNLLQLTAKLIRTIFDKDEGLFAVLGNTLGKAFGFDPKNILAPILNGVELFTLVIERLRDFFASASFKKFLTVFDPLKTAIEGINFKDGLSAAEIGTFVDGLFESVRGIFKNITGFIKGINAGEVGDILGNIVGEIIDTLPALLDTIFTSITKVIDILIETINSTEFNESKLGTVIAKIASGLAALIPKVIQLVATAVPKLLSSLTSAFFQADLGGKIAIAGLVAQPILKLLTGKGIVDTLKDGLRNQLQKIPLIGNLFKDRGDPAKNAAAARGSDRQRWELLFTKLDRIIECVCNQRFGGLGDLLDLRRGRRGLPGRGFRTPRLPAASLRPPGNILPPVTPRIPSAPRFTAPRLPSSPVSVIPRGSARAGSIDVTPIRPGAPRPPVPGTGGSATTGLFRNIRNFFTEATSRIPRINPLRGAGNVLKNVRQSVSSLAENTAAQSRILRNQFRAGFNRPNVAIGTSAAPSRAFRAGEIARNLQRGAQNLPGQISTQASRATQAVRGIPEATRGLNARMMGTTPGAAARYTSRFGQFAGARRGLTSVLGRAALPLLAATTIFGAASILGTPGAKAEELEEQGYTKEEIEQIRKQEKRDKTRGLTGLGASLAGGAAGGAAGAKLGALAGSFFGPGLGTAIGAGVGGIAGGILGSIFGEQAVQALSDPIIDGITSFGEGIGSFFSGLWSNISSGFSSAMEGLGKFFGSEGPIQRFARWYFSLPGNIAKGVFGAITGFFGEDGPIQQVGKFFFDLPGKIFSTLAELGESIFDGLRGAAVAVPAGILRTIGFGDLADKLEGKDKEEEKEPSPNFAGGFNLIGGRTSFNEREAIGMPDGVTYIPLTSSTTLDKFVGKTIETTNNMEVTINVNGAADPRQVAQAVIEEIDNVFKSVTSTT